MVRRHVVVDASIEKAFSVFTDRFGDFKPREHSLLGAPIVETVFEPRVGGNIVDRAEDGSECRWARILAYDPPHRVVFSWDIGPTWQVEPDPALTSEVEVTFTAETADRTRVDLEHRNIDRHGPGWSRSATASSTRRAGRCTWTGTPHCSTRHKPRQRTNARDGGAAGTPDRANDPEPLGHWLHHAVRPVASGPPALARSTCHARESASTTGSTRPQAIAATLIPPTRADL
ncbi:SRPBCC family protein [Catellatospora bangladeshensis]|uniref:SRPBCC family protein n=1 Tax=Catellatospora bangladeshensis TaxID=310355 RepID=UPI0036098127